MPRCVPQSHKGCTAWACKTDLFEESLDNKLGKKSLFYHEHAKLWSIAVRVGNWELVNTALIFPNVFLVAKLLGTNHHRWGEFGLFPCIPSPCKYPPVFVLQLCVADSVPAPAACQRHVAAGAHGSQQRRHDISLSLCHFQLPAGTLGSILSMVYLGEHTATPSKNLLNMS